jgi:hypothetical protein
MIGTMGINLLALVPSDVGRWVVYTNGVGETEMGRIKGWNHRVVFVVYKTDDQWNRYQDFTVAATDPKDLNWLNVLREGCEADLCVCGHARSSHDNMGKCASPDCACGPGCIHDGFVRADRKIDPDGDA